MHCRPPITSVYQPIPYTGSSAGWDLPTCEGQPSLSIEATPSSLGNNQSTVPGPASPASHWSLDVRVELADTPRPRNTVCILVRPPCFYRGVLYVLSPQCKMSLNGQRGECWCVNPNTGKLIQGAPTIRGDPECHLFYNEQQGARGVHTQRMQ